MTQNRETHTRQGSGSPCGGALGHVQSVQLEGMEAISDNTTAAIAISDKLQQRLADGHLRSTVGPISGMRATYKSWREVRQATVGALSLRPDIPLAVAAEALRATESGPTDSDQDDAYDHGVADIANQYRGGTRQLIIDTCVVAAPITEQTLGTFNPRERQALGKAFEVATCMQAEAAERLIYELFGRRWLASLPPQVRKNPYAHGGQGLKRQQRRLLAALNLTSDVGTSFTGAIRGGIELSAVNIADLHYSLAKIGRPQESFSAVTIANIGKVSCWALGHFWRARMALVRRQKNGPEQGFIVQGSDVQLQDPYLRRLYDGGIPQHCVGAFPVIKPSEQTRQAFGNLVAEITTAAGDQQSDMNELSVVRSSHAVGALTAAIVRRNQLYCQDSN